MQQAPPHPGQGRQGSTASNQLGPQPSLVAAGAVRVTLAAVAAVAAVAAAAVAVVSQTAPLGLAHLLRREMTLRWTMLPWLRSRLMTRLMLPWLTARMGEKCRKALTWVRPWEWVSAALPRQVRLRTQRFPWASAFGRPN